MSPVYIPPVWDNDPIGVRMLAGTAGLLWFMASVYGANLFAQIMMGAW